MNWAGVMPAVTTPFKEDLSLDINFFEKHIEIFQKSGCTGIVIGGSLGEGATLTFEEKKTLIEVAVSQLNGKMPVILGVSSLSTLEAVEQSKMAAMAGCEALMVLPPYVYRGDWRETKAHMSAVIESTDLPCMLYNNPVAYGTDTVPEQVAELAEKHKNLVAIKESSTDVRRLAGIRALIGDRLHLFVGVDDVIVEGVAMGAVGWIAGLVNAFPKESVDLFNLSIQHKKQIDSSEVMNLYSWFLPLLRLDTVPKFVQLIKLVQQEVGLGNERVRMPRMVITGEERASCLKVLEVALKSRPA